MTRKGLVQSYLEKGRARLQALGTLRDLEDHSDVVREAQELVELMLKAVLRAVGVEPPKFHDVGPLLREHRARFPPEIAEHLDRAAEISAALRADRELAFCGDIDWIPTERYTAAHSARAYEQASWVLRLAETVIARLPA